MWSACLTVSVFGRLVRDEQMDVAATGLAATMQGGCCCKPQACTRKHDAEHKLLGWRSWQLTVHGNTKDYCCKMTRKGSGSSCPTSWSAYQTAAADLHEHLGEDHAGDATYMCRDPACPLHASPYHAPGGEVERREGLKCRCNPGYAALKFSGVRSRLSVALRESAAPPLGAKDVYYLDAAGSDSAGASCQPIECPPNSEVDGDDFADVCACSPG